MAMSENGKKVLAFLKENTGDYTAADVAAALGLEKRTVDGCFTGLQRKAYGERIPAEITLEDGSHKAVKILHLTDAGMAFDPDAQE